MFARFIYVITYIDQYFITFYGPIIFIVQLTDILYIHSSIVGYLGCFYFWVLKIVLLWTFMCMFLFEYLFSMFSGINSQWNYWVICNSFEEPPVFHSACTIVHYHHKLYFESRKLIINYINAGKFEILAFPFQIQALGSKWFS